MLNCTGFRNWKNATDECKGLSKHSSTEGHREAMENRWNYLKRNTKSVAQSFVTARGDQRKWLFAIFNVTRYLSAIGLSFRGSAESDILV